MHWFKYYKTSDGKPVNALSREEPASAEAALGIIDRVSQAYDRLVQDKARMESLGLK